MLRSPPEPAVSRRALILSAGLFWIIGGLFLLARAGSLLADGSFSPAWPLVIGLTVAVVKYLLIFRRVVTANVRRITELSPHKDKICLFAFQSVESYLLVIVMISLGLAIRFLGLPKLVLAGVYFTVGFSLIISSSLYFRLARRV